MKNLNHGDLRRNTIYIDAREKGGPYDRSRLFRNYFLKLRREKLKKKGFNQLRFIEFEKTLEIGDFAFENCVVEFKEFENFKQDARSGELTRYVENLHMSDYKSKMLLVRCTPDEYEWLYNANDLYKGVVRFGDKVNIMFAPDYTRCWESIIHMFCLNAHHMVQPPRNKMKKNYNYAHNMLWATHELSEGQIKKIIRKTRITTIPHVLNLSSNILMECGIKKEQAERVIKVLKGEPLI